MKISRTKANLIRAYSVDAELKEMEKSIQKVLMVFQPTKNFNPFCELNLIDEDINKLISFLKNIELSTETTKEEKLEMKKEFVEVVTLLNDFKKFNKKNETETERIEKISTSKGDPAGIFR